MDFVWLLETILITPREQRDMNKYLTTWKIPGGWWLEKSQIRVCNKLGILRNLEDKTFSQSEKESVPATAPQVLTIFQGLGTFVDSNRWALYPIKKAHP